MKALTNFEAAQDTHSAKDDASTNLYNSIVNDLGFKQGATGGKNSVSSSDSTPLVQNDLPQAFQGSADFEIVDNEIGQSLTRRQPADEVTSSGQPAGATAEMQHSPAKALQKLQNPINELLELPSSGKPIGAMPEKPALTERSDKQGSVFTPRNDSAREAQSSGHPVGASPEKLPVRHHGPIKFSRTAGKPSEARSTGAPTGATAETQLNETSATAPQGGIADNTMRDEARSSGRPRGASAESQLKVHPLGNHNGSTADNLKQTDSTKEVPSSKKPDGAQPESKLNTKHLDHRSSTADPEQQNRGLEIEGRRRNERATQEQRLSRSVSVW